MSEPQTKKSKSLSTLDQLKAITTIVADTGDFEGTKHRNSRALFEHGVVAPAARPPERRTFLPFVRIHSDLLANKRCFPCSSVLKLKVTFPLRKAMQIVVANHKQILITALLFSTFGSNQQLISDFGIRNTDFHAQQMIFIATLQGNESNRN